MYIRKKGYGQHRALGVQPVNLEEENEIREIFGNGKQGSTLHSNTNLRSMVVWPQEPFSEKCLF